MKKEEFFEKAANGVGPLEGIRILEAATYGAGPIAITVLVDLGAESWKVEMPVKGDSLREVGPFMDENDPVETNLWNLSYNRNKKSISLDMRKPEGKEIFKELVKKVDIVHENYKPGTLAKWGLSYEEIKKVKPDIIYCSVSGFGQFGPYHERAGYDPVGQAMGGLMSITGFPNRPPTRTGGYLCDNLTAWMGAIGILSALQHHSQTGEGQHVDVCMVDTMLYLSEINIAATSHTSFRWPRIGNRYFDCSPANTYPCEDGYVCIAVALDSHWAKFCQLIGQEDLLEDPRFKTIDERGREHEFIDKITEEWTRQHTVQEVVDALGKAGLVVAPVLNYDQILQDPHIQERDMIAEADHPKVGKYKLYGVAAKFSLTPGRVRTAGPLVGQHNEEVYCGVLGYSKEKMACLKREGII